jgi:Holliday junction resolvase RusA-like endonuclease
MDWTIWTPAPDVTAYPWPISPASIVCRFTFETQPIPAARARSGQGHHYTPEPYRSYLKELAWLVRARYRGPVLDGALGLRAFFFRDSRRVADKDNLSKAVGDAGSGIVWENDRQLVEGFDRVFFDPDRPRTEALVYRTLA